MSTNIEVHPTLVLHQDIQDICRPLKKLDIDYFSHVLVTPENEFSAIASNPHFAKHYFKKKYYNVDVHMENINLSTYIMEDMLELRGSSAKLQSVAASFGIKHVFTIVEEDAAGKHCYHFANSGESFAINQSYLSNLDLLKAFIDYFKEQLKSSKALAEAHQFKFTIAPNAKGFQTVSHSLMLNHDDREIYLDSIGRTIDKVSILNKTTNQRIDLTLQQSKCIHLLARGYSNKQIAITLGLSIRTVEHYLAKIRYLLKCHSSKELITLYHASMNLNGRCLL